MGLYDREYYRKEQPQGMHLGGNWSMVTTLIVINAVVYVADLFSGYKLNYFLAVKSDLFTHPWNAWQLVTAGFAHNPQDVMHIVFNMLGLYIFGRELEDLYGRQEFLRLYLTFVIMANLVWVIVANSGEMWFAAEPSEALGASGGVVGTIILFICNFPHRTLMIWGVLPMPAWLLGTLIIAQDVIGSLDASSKVAHAAHLGGAAFGYLYFRTRWTLWKLIPRGISLKAFKPKPRLRIHDAPPQDDGDLRERVDQILAKISAQGEASLTPAERRTLEDASRRYQDRRR